MPRLVCRVAAERPGRRSSDPTKLTPLEIDAVVLTCQRWARLLQSTRSHTLAFGWIEPLANLQRLQVMVDEITDFSPVQVAILVELTPKDIRSFFACGDFNQRVSSYGLRDQADLDWIAAKTSTVPIQEHIQIAYRQGQGLLALASALAPDALIDVRHGGDSSVVHLPLLLEDRSSLDVGEWLAERVMEIKEIVGKHPSIGVFVDGAEQVSEFVRSCKTSFDDFGLAIKGYPGGQAVGHDEEVRVFDIRDVKGLEFEATFVIGLDRMAEQHGELAAKLLFVGVTRAATFLGVTCEAELPESLTALRAHFAIDAHGWLDSNEIDVRTQHERGEVADTAIEFKGGGT